VIGRRHRVAYVAHAFMMGGAEEMVLNLVRYLPERFEPVIVCINQAGPMGEEIRKTGVEFHVLGLDPGVRHPWHIVDLNRRLQAIAPDIVHTFLLTASLYGRFAAMLAGVPIVIGTEVNIYEQKQRHHILVERWLMRHTDRVIVSARSVRDFYIAQVGADPAKVDVIYNAVDWSQLQTSVSRQDLRAQVGVPDEVPLAGIIARLTEQKAHTYLFDAMASYPGLATMHLLVVGDGALRTSLESRVAQLGLHRRVHFLGARRDLGNLLAAVDLFVMPSLWEGLPLAMVLAMGAGLPVVATAVAGIPEVVQDGASGLLVPPADAPALGAALARLVADAGLRRSLGERAAAFVRPRFGADGYLASVTTLYDRLLAEKAMTPALSGAEG
jgi:glycosyltransferase involved in cell wall biosynthesis